LAYLSGVLPIQFFWFVLPNLSLLLKKKKKKKYKQSKKLRTRRMLNWSGIDRRHGPYTKSANQGTQVAHKARHPGDDTYVSETDTAVSFTRVRAAQTTTVDRPVRGGPRRDPTRATSRSSRPIPSSCGGPSVHMLHVQSW